MDFSKLPLASGSATALLGLVVLLFLLGRIIPRSHLEDVRADRDKRLEEKQREADLWKSAYITEVGANRELSNQVTTLMEYARTADHVLRSLPVGSGEAPNDGSSRSGSVSR